LPAALPRHPRLELIALAATAAVAAAGLITALMFSPAEELPGDLAYQAFTVVGALLYLRRPRNPIGPLLVLAGVGSALAAGTGAVLQQVRDGSLDLSSPLIHAIGAVQSLAWLPSIVVPLTFITLLFPDGTVLSPRWAVVGRVAAVAVAVPAVGLPLSVALIPTKQVLAPTPDFATTWPRLIYGVTLVSLFVALGCGILGVASLFVRYRRGGERTREQIKLILFAAVIAVAATVLDGALGLSASVFAPLGISLIAVAVAVAVTRYRLYDSRTLSYTVVTAILVGLYLSCVALTTHALPFSSAIGVAASTLIAAAAFHPVRRRVQTVVDRRFHRARYDAERVLDTFAHSMRRTVEAAAINAELADTVQRTVQPSTMSLWVARSP
jgi:hypothetical protein